MRAFTVVAGFGLAFSALIPAAGPAVAQSVRFVTEQFPPFNFVQEGELTGWSVDLVREMARRADVDASIQVLSWHRAYTQAQQRTDTCVFSTARLPQREALFTWIGPLNRGGMALYALADDPVTPRTLEDLQGRRVGGVRSDAATLVLQGAGLVVDETPGDEVNPIRLREGRIDLWVSGDDRAAAFAAERGVAVRKVLTVDVVDQYLACNSGFDADMAARLTAAHVSMQDDGTARRIAEKWTR